MHKFQVVEKFSFKEKRFLNVGGGETPSAPPAAPKAPAVPTPAPVAPAPAPAPVAAQPEVPVVPHPVVAPNAAPAVPAAPASAPEAVPVVEAERAKVQDQTTKDSQALQADIARVAAEKGDTTLLEKYFKATEKLNNYSSKAEITASKLNFDGEKDRIYAEIYKVFEGVDLSSLNGFFEIVGEGGKPVTDQPKLNDGIRAMVSAVVRNSFIKQANAQTKHLDAFLKTPEGLPFKDTEITANFSYKNNAATTVVAGGKEYDDAYKIFADKQAAVALTPEQQAAKAKSVELRTVAAKIEYIKKLPFAGILKAFGYGNGTPAGDAKLEKLFSDGDPILAFFLQAFGYGPILGLGDFSEVAGSIPGGAGESLMKMHEQLKKSKYGIDSVKIDVSTLTTGPETAPVYEKFDVKFADTVRNATELPATGIILEKEFKLEGTNPTQVVVDLNNGGEIVLPANMKLKIDGVEVSAPSDGAKTFKKDTPEVSAKKGIITLTGIIPAGTIFTSKCKLSATAPVSAATPAAAPAAAV